MRSNRYPRRLRVDLPKLTQLVMNGEYEWNYAFCHPHRITLESHASIHHSHVDIPKLERLRIRKDAFRDSSVVNVRRRRFFHFFMIRRRSHP